MYQAQVNEYRYDVERLNRELQEVKRKYFQQKRKDQMVKEMGLLDGSTEMDGNQHTVAMSKTAPLMMKNEQIAAAKQARTKFTGGGFAIK